MRWYGELRSKSRDAGGDVSGLHTHPEAMIYILESEGYTRSGSTMPLASLSLPAQSSVCAVE